MGRNWRRAAAFVEASLRNDGGPPAKTPCNEVSRDSLQSKEGGKDGDSLNLRNSCLILRVALKNAGASSGGQSALANLQTTGAHLPSKNHPLRPHPGPSKKDTRPVELPFVPYAGWQSPSTRNAGGSGPNVRITGARLASSAVLPDAGIPPPGETSY